MRPKAFLEDPRQPSLPRTHQLAAPPPLPRLLSVPPSFPQVRGLCAGPRVPAAPSPAAGVNYNSRARSGGRGQAAAGGSGHRGGAASRRKQFSRGPQVRIVPRGAAFSTVSREASAAQFKVTA